MPRIELGAAGREARILPLCYAAPQPTAKSLSHQPGLHVPEPELALLLLLDPLLILLEPLLPVLLPLHLLEDVVRDAECLAHLERPSGLLGRLE